MRSWPITLACLALASTGFAAAKDAPKPKAAQAPPQTPAVPDDDPDLANAGKVIEIDTSGKAKVIKGDPGDPAAAQTEEKAVAPKDEKLKPTEISRTEACKLRFAAECAVLKRCLTQGTELPMDCEELIAACDQSPPGKAPFTRKAVEACTKGVAALKCESIDWKNPGAADPESHVSACKPVLDAEKSEAGKPALLPAGKSPGSLDLKQLDQQIGNALSGE